MKEMSELAVRPVLTSFFVMVYLDKSQRELKFCQNTSIIQSDSTQDNT